MHAQTLTLDDFRFAFICTGASAYGYMKLARDAGHGLNRPS